MQYGSGDLKIDHAGPTIRNHEEANSIYPNPNNNNGDYYQQQQHNQSFNNNQLQCVGYEDMGSLVGSVGSSLSIASTEPLTAALSDPTAALNGYVTSPSWPLPSEDDYPPTSLWDYGDPFLFDSI